MGLSRFVSTRFHVLFHSPTGVLFTFPSRYYALSVITEYLALEDGPPSFKQGFSCPALLTNSSPRPLHFAYGTITRYGAAFQPASTMYRFGNSAVENQLDAGCRTTPLHATPDRLHVCGLGFSQFARHYYGNLG
jgi:hypothetical protein